ncbi:MAG: TonB family protein [Candidatus Omnitrophota bacterium]
MIKRPDRYIFVGILTFCLFLWLSPALEGNAAEEVVETLTVGETRVFYAHSPSRVAITNPQVADVTDVTGSDIVINAKSSGRTKLFFQDAYGDHSFDLKVITEDMGIIKERVDNLLARLNLGEVYTKAEDEENKVFILGNVRDEEDKERINLVLGVLADKTVDLTVIKEEKAVVSIDVQVLEVDKDATTTLGLTNPLSTTTGLAVTEIASPALASTTWGQIFRVTNVMRPTAFNWTLYALIQEGKARILSRPRLACQSGKEAELLVGGEKPTFTTDVASAGGQGTEVDYKEYGIKLKIRPTVAEDKRIKLALNVDVSEIGDVEYIGAAANRTAQAYPLTKRSAVTELYLNNGQTMAIGGLIKKKTEEDITRTPWLSDVPVLGALFRKKVSRTGGGSGERGDVELFITLTPTIINQEEGLAQEEEKDSALGEVVDTNINVVVPEALSGYASVIQRRILEQLAYPPAAKDAGFRGTVKLKLHLSYNGELLDAEIKDSSGYNILDENAIAAAKGIVSYPPFPPAIDSQDIWVEIPVVYQLDE